MVSIPGVPALIEGKVEERRGHLVLPRTGRPSRNNSPQPPYLASHRDLRSARGTGFFFLDRDVGCPLRRLQAAQS
jgi:hypothetical protein